MCYQGKRLGAARGVMGVYARTVFLTHPITPSRVPLAANVRSLVPHSTLTYRCLVPATASTCSSKAGSSYTCIVIGFLRSTRPSRITTLPGERTRVYLATQQSMALALHSSSVASRACRHGSSRVNAPVRYCTAAHGRQWALSGCFAV